ncbi:uncharacterized protein LOC113361123 [Papaver somniferum]|uniref:uncharacterized protein LOC113361123 n=1 Tax=Papaver somniferum TaxID=3469 RepID=UPI000E6F8539|nr:uncharacterized protein LOC113361123 [Papaver somniferum]
MCCFDDLKEIKIHLDRITFAVRKIIAEISGLLKDLQVSLQQMEDTTGDDEKTEMLIEVLTGSLAEYTLVSKGLNTMSENVNRLEYTLEIALQKKNVAISQFGLIMTNLGVSNGIVAAVAELFGVNVRMGIIGSERHVLWWLSGSCITLGVLVFIVLWIISKRRGLLD